MSKQLITLIAGLLCLAVVWTPTSAAPTAGGLSSSDSDAEVSAEQGNPPNDGLIRVQQRMKEAETILVARDASGKASATQQKVMDELDGMIAQLQKECQKRGGQCNKPAAPSNRSSKQSAKRGGKPGETVGVAKTQGGAAIDRAAVSSLVKDIWGRLPQRQQEELLQPLSEEFLPEYAADIEEYFRSLAKPPEGATAPEQQR